MALLDVDESQAVEQALQCVRDLLPKSKRRRFREMALDYVYSGLENPPPRDAPCRPVLVIVKLIADLGRSRAELLKNLVYRGRIIEELREICDPGRVREIFEMPFAEKPIEYGERE